MRQNPGKSLSIVVIVMPNFNLAATVGFIDPFRAANYLDGCAHFRWEIVSVGGGSIMASNAMAIATTALAEIQDRAPDIAILSSSWTPELHGSPALHSTLKRWSRKGVTLGALDTGAFILAKLRLLAGRRATVHYEHLDAFRELYPDIRVSDQLFVLDGDRITCCGGSASLDFAIQIIRQIRGDTLANSTARYLFHDRLRPHGARQNMYAVEPLGTTVPQSLRKAIEVMESNLESTVSIPDICRRVGISQRQLDRLFRQRVQQTPAAYYRDIRLDRARGLVTQTEMPLSEVAVAAGFASQVHFSRAYRQRFRVPPRRDRIEGRVPFEFRAAPHHRPSMAKKVKKKANSV